MDNGQIFVTCEDSGVADLWVDKLNGLENTSIKKCHSYTDKEIPVKMNVIHSSIDIQKDIVEGFYPSAEKPKGYCYEQRVRPSVDISHF